MQWNLPPRAQTACAEIRIEIAEQKSALKKHEAHSPYGGGAPEPRQNYLREKRLDKKEEKGA
jgi:hypothetical protein